ncbi:MAG: hypothetical protein LUG85_00585 [Clostridiales bacterium]|nr:hypothetical protein [Clostridiales bacterium]MCD7827024.1 hypothetical protein [Clostridiales bacterium]
MLSLPGYITPDFEKEPFASSPDAAVSAAEGNFLPDNFYSTTVFPEYVKINGEWILLKESRMDAVVVIKDGVPVVTEPRNVKDGDKVVVCRSDDGSNGVYVQSKAFRYETVSENESELFRSGSTRETSQTRDYESLYEVLKYDRTHGFILWVLGAACAFDYDSRKAMANLIKAGYCDALVSGNALASYDLEAAVFNTCCGQDIYNKRVMKNGRYNQLDVQNLVRKAGSVENYITESNIHDGIMSALVRYDIPYILAGSSRDDGPLPGVVSDMNIAQDKIREFAKKATTVVTLASQSGTVAVSSLTPSYKVENGTIRPVYFFTVDISEFIMNKIRTRGLNGANGIVTNIQDCLVNLERNLI